MLCHECQCEIYAQEPYVRVRILGATESMVFHHTRQHDCWDEYRRRSPTIRMAIATQHYLIEYKKHELN